MAEVSINLEAMAEAIQAAESAERYIPEAVDILERHLRALEMDTAILRPWRHDGGLTHRLRERIKELKQRQEKAKEVDDMRFTFHPPATTVTYDEIQLSEQAEETDYTAMVANLKKAWLTGTLDASHLLAFSDLLRLHAMNPVFMKTLAGSFTQVEMAQFLDSLDHIATTLPAMIRDKLGLWSGFTDAPGTGLPSTHQLIPVDTTILDTDRMDPAVNAQNNVGDCWLIATLNALMESPSGDQLLRDNVRWDPVAQGYWVTLYKPVNGLPEEFLVTEVIDGGATADGVQGIVSLYEAAVYQMSGWSGLEGKMPWDGPAIIQGKIAQNWTGLVLPISDNAAETGGSADGGVTLATTIPLMWGDHFPAQVVDSNGGQVWIEVPANHVMEVVDIRLDGMIGLRNPWGFWRIAGNTPGSVSGVVYMTPETFDDTFIAHTSTEWTLP